MRERIWYLLTIAHIQSGQVNLNHAAGVDSGPAKKARMKLNGIRVSYDTPDTLSAASIFIWTRRAANAAILVLVLPVRMRSPIWNCQCQISGSTVAATLYRMPL